MSGGAARSGQSRFVEIAVEPLQGVGGFLDDSLAEGRTSHGCSFFAMTTWYSGRLSPSCATCLPMTAPRADEDCEGQRDSKQNRCDPADSQAT